jgi:hypothetical protein
MNHVRYLLFIIVFGAGAMSAAPAFAQSIPGFSGGSSALSGAAGNLMGGGGSSSMLSQGLPSLSSSSTGNVAGVLSYCIQNNIIQGSSATSALSALTGRSGVTSSSGYTAGQQGDIQSGNGNSFSLSGVKDQIKTKACDLVLQHAHSML